VRIGIFLQNGEVTNTSTGTIAGGDDGVKIADVAKVSNAGTISGGIRGINIGPANTSSNVEISNSGTITGALNGIESLRRVDLTNSGSISGTTGTGIVGASADITNTSTGTITGGLDAIQATTAASRQYFGRRGHRHQRRHCGGSEYHIRRDFWRLRGRRGYNRRQRQQRRLDRGWEHRHLRHDR
jgi:hypothetical protein